MESQPNISRTPRQLGKLPPCRSGCPSGTDVRGWLSVVAQRSKYGYSAEEAYERAWRMIVERNPFPATMGRICPHPCESGCNRSGKDGAVAVNAMERFLGDWAIDRGLPLPIDDGQKWPESVGVIGSGPAGLSFAYQMARRGYPVTVYERQDAPGGMLRFGIPDYRLPAKVLDAEIDRIVQTGVSLKLNTRIGRDLSAADLSDRHDTLFLGVGASLGRALGVEGEIGSFVYSGVEFLEAFSRGEAPPVGRRVVVVGGGNTAIDAARSARRLGADVSIMYRRSRTEMPAIKEEIDEAVAEGVDIEYLTSPVAIHRTGDRVRAVSAVRMKLGEPDDSGRRRPIPIPDSVVERPVDSVIVAVAQKPDWEGIASFVRDGDWATLDGHGSEGLRLWAGGDVTGPGIASTAIGHGRRAAERAHAKLRGLPIPVTEPEPDSLAADLNLDYYAERDRLEIPAVEPERRLANPDLEVAGTISEHEFLAEASRCMSCGMCIGCGYCQMFCNADGFARVIEPRPGHHFVLLLDRCESCGKCIEVCPCGFLTADVNR